MALLNCPFLTVGAEEGFWRPLLETIKAHETQALPPTVLKWSGLKDYVNSVICRQRRDRTKGNVVPPRRKSSPVLYELDTWIDKWIEVGKFREVQVLEFKLSNAVKELFGRSRLEDVMGRRTDELEISMADPNFSIYRPEVSEAVHRCREQLKRPPDDPDDPQSDSDEINTKLDHPHSSEAESSNHWPCELVRSDTTPFVDPSPGSAEDRGSREHIFRTSSRSSREPSIRKKGKEAATRRCSITEDGSVILGSTQATGFMELKRSVQQKNELTSRGANDLYPLKACSEIVPSPVSSASDDDEDLPELSMALFSTGGSGLKQSSSTPRITPITPCSSTASEHVPSEKTTLQVRNEGAQLQEKRRSTDGNTSKSRLLNDSHTTHRLSFAGEGSSSCKAKEQEEMSSVATASNQSVHPGMHLCDPISRYKDKPHIAEGSGPAQDRVARTPALVAKENTRYALKHTKPLAPVNVPHRNELSKQPSPNRSKPTSRAEIEARLFYASSRGDASKTGRDTFVTPLPLAETPLPTPTKAFKNYETSPSVAGKKPIHRQVDSFEANPTEVDGTSIPDETEHYVLPELETWYNQQTKMPCPVQSMETEKRTRDQAGFSEGKHNSSERSRSRDTEDAFVASTASKAAKSDIPCTSSGTRVRPSSRDSTKGAPNTAQTTHYRTESFQSKKRKRGSHSSPAQKSSDVRPFALTDVTKSPAAAISNANSSPPIANQSNKRQRRRRLTYENWETSTSPRTDQDYDTTPSPTPPKEQRMDDGLSSRPFNERQCKGHRIFGNCKSGRKPEAKFQANQPRAGQAQWFHRAQQRSKRSSQSLPSSQKGRSRPQTPQTPQTPHATNRGQPSFSLTPKRNQDDGQQQFKRQQPQRQAFTRDRFTTPATLATMQSPASSGLFVPFGSSAQSGKRSSGSNSSRQKPNIDLQGLQPFPERQQEQQRRAIREGTECTEDFRHWTPTSQVNGIRNRFTELRHKQQQLNRDFSRLAKRVEICDYGR
ncbi:hypothetical protein SLS62_005538 [Diatrype stigma]|uniref:Uncharacterized protein n=1 Tax=Diatrype stigma TaxID=117547 RepID=A0AAN9YST6_9PEZI